MPPPGGGPIAVPYSKLGRGGLPFELELDGAAAPVAIPTTAATVAHAAIAAVVCLIRVRFIWKVLLVGWVKLGCLPAGASLANLGGA